MILDYRFYFFTFVTFHHFFPLFRIRSYERNAIQVKPFFKKKATLLFSSLVERWKLKIKAAFNDSQLNLINPVISLKF